MTISQLDNYIYPKKIISLLNQLNISQKEDIILKISLSNVYIIRYFYYFFKNEKKLEKLSHVTQPNVGGIIFKGVKHKKKDKD